MEITPQDIMAMYIEVAVLLDEKRLTETLASASRERVSVLLASEASEIAQAYKRQGLEDGKEAIMLECAGTAIRAMNVWKIYGSHLGSGDAEDIIWAAQDYSRSEKYQEPWQCLRAIIALGIENPSTLYSIDIIALCIHFCHYFLKEPFTTAFRMEMDKNWDRPVQFNLAKEHQTL